MSMTQANANRGSILVAALMAVLIAGMAVGGMALYTHEIHRLNERAIALEKASATAEAGLFQIIHYFNHPTDIPSNCAAYRTLINTFFDEGMDPAPIRAANMTFINAYPGSGSSLNSNLIVFDRANVTDLKVLPPRAGAAAGTIFTFSSRAVAAPIGGGGGRVTRTALMDVAFDQAPRIAIPAAIITASSVSGNGQFNMNWGQAWAKGPINLLINRKNNPAGEYWNYTAGSNQVDHLDDQWVAYRSVNYIRDSAGANLSNVLTVNDVGSRCVASGSDFSRFQNILFQHEDAFTPAGQQTLSQKIDGVINEFAATGNPNRGYEYWKQAAIRRDTYFRTSSSGAIYNSSGQRLYLYNGKLNTAGQGTALTASSAMDYYRTLPEVYVAFFDTTDGNPPNAGGTNWANINFTGSIANRSQGVLYVAGNLSVGGSGTPPAVSVIDPNSQNHSLNVFHDGVVFTHGNWSYQGNPVVYGAIVCKGTYNCGGTPNVYYNIKLATGDPQPLSTRARILGTLIQ